jgi:hypothetical protein
MIGVTQSRKWLQDNKLHESIVFSWTGSKLIEVLREKDIHIFAVIGSPDMLAEIKDIRKFSFIETDDGTEVADWSDILKKLQ